MSTKLARKHLPFLLLLLFLTLIGVFSFKDFGISWDEPYFYNYADSIGNAFDPGFYHSGSEPESIYGISAADHKYYGPAYLLLAQPIAEFSRSLFHVTIFQAWHLVNFGFFIVGVFFLYLTLLRWTSTTAAAAATSLFALQPLLLGHAYINPKDMPFLVFSLISAHFGLKALTAQPKWQVIGYTGLFGIFLGFSASVRVIGPIIGLAFVFSFISKRNWKIFARLVVAGVIALVVMVASWPFLWSDPINNLRVVLRHMSNNPTELAVLYEGVIFRANDMPSYFIPKMLALTLTEPVWIIAAMGTIVLVISPKVRKFWIEILPFALVFGFILTYILIARPAVYDGFRHFLFILPIVFILAAFAFDALFEKLTKKTWSFWSIVMIALLPGAISIATLHPYEYTYYNNFSGGVGGAFRVYETDYWLTCYEPAIEWFSSEYPDETLYIQRELPLAEASAKNEINLAALPPYNDPPKSGYYLFHTRANLDLRSQYRRLPILQSFGVDGAEFCLIKQAP